MNYRVRITDIPIISYIILINQRDISYIIVIVLFQVANPGRFKRLKAHREAHPLSHTEGGGADGADSDCHGLG